MAKIIGIDAVLFIYLLEQNKRYLKQTKQIFNQLQTGDIGAILSAIGLIEILTGPKRQKRNDIAADYKRLIVNFPNLRIIGLTENIVDLASDLRAKYKLATPDAIHIATAIDANADEFITSDKALRKVKEIKVRVLV